MKLDQNITNQMEVKLENRNILKSILSTVLLLVVFSTQSLAIPGEGETAKVPNSFFDNIVMSGAGTAKVFSTDKGIQVSFDNPYDPNNPFNNQWAGTFNGDVDGESAKFYCIDLAHGIAFYKDEPGKRFEYTDDGPTSNEITYILNYYYPYVSYPYTGALNTEAKEATAIQLAIWHFADGLDISSISSTEIKNRTQAIVDDANANAGDFYPLETLVIVPSSQTLPYGSNGEFYVGTFNINGDPIPGITVNFSATTGTLSATSAVTNSSGYTQTILLTQGASDFSEIMASASVKVPQGTRYVQKNAPDTYQKLVLATPAGLNRQNTATVNWYEPDIECDLNGFATYTQGGWGSPSNSGPGTIRDLYFNNVFPTGLTVGGNFTIHLTSATAVKNFLPQGGTAAALTQNYTDPTTNINVFAGQVVALTLNVYYHDAGYLGSNPYSLGDLIITTGPLSGLTVYQLLAYANTALGGGSTPYTFSQLNDAATAVNENFNEGANKGFLDCDDTQPCLNKIGDFVWHDKNVNGIQDNGEPGIEGVVVELTYGSTTVTTTTDANGYYEFTGLPNGTYSVKVASSNYATGGVLESTTQTKWYSTKKNQGSDDSKDSDANKNESVTVTLDCADDMTIDFGFYKTCVSLIKEGPATAKPGDVITYTFTIENCGDVTLSGGVDVYDPLINPSGDNKIKNVTPVTPGETRTFTKSYTVKDSDCGDLVNHAWAIGHPIDGSANVRFDTEWTTFIDCEPDCEGEIGNRVWLDLDCDGIQDNDEVGIPNVKVILKNANHEVIAETFTNSNGIYTFTELCAGTYFVFVDESTLPDGYTPAPTYQGGNPAKDSNENGEEVILPTDNSKDYTIDFGYCAPFEEPEVDIEVIKSASTSNPSDGDIFTYTILVKNNGPDDAHGVQVTDQLPDGVVYLSHNASAGSYDNNTGVWMVGNLANGASETLTISVQVDVEDVNNATFNLGVASDYNLFVLYDVNQPSSDTEGKVAVGRNAYFANYSIGDKLPPNSGDVLIVGNNLEYISGAVYNGNVVYGNSTNLDSEYYAVSITGGTLRQDTPIDFAAAEGYLLGLSSTLFGYSVNGTTTMQWGGLKLTGTDPYLNVFMVDGADLSSANDFQINVPNGSVVLVNVSGTTVGWTGGLTVTGTSIGNVLYNFKDATSITIQGIDVRGSILAPKAHVNFAAGVQNGQMICKSLEGMGQFNNSKFIGNIPTETQIVNVAVVTGVIELDTNPDNDMDEAVVVVNGTDPGTGNGGGNGGSGNGGWEYVGNFLDGQIVWSLAYTEDGCILVGTLGGAIYKSNTEGTEFTLINEGMNVGFIWSLLVYNGYYFAGTEQGVFMYNGSSWVLVGLVGMDVRSLSAVDGKIYAGVWGGGVYVSSDNGATWTQLTSELLSWSAVQDITVHLSGNFNVELFVATLGNGICFSPDGGVNWTKLNIDYQFVWSIASTSAGVLFAGTYGDGLYTSNDNGLTWTKVFGVNAQYIYDITVDLNDNVYISTLLGGIFVSTDGGSSFSNAGMGGIGTSSVLAIGGSSESNSSVYVGTSNGSIYRKVGDNGVTSVDDQDLPREFRLDQNYPNPFNPSTTIQFAVPKAGEYKVVIYNILGQQVAELLNTNLQPGVHKVQFNANQLASGVYIYQLIGDKVNFTKKMVLMK